MTFRLRPRICKHCRETFRGCSKRVYCSEECKKARSAENLTTKKSMKEYVKKKKVAPCADCGGSFPTYVMDFHHVRGEKLFALSKASSYSKVRVDAELAKCVLICSNCHRIRHNEARIDL